MSRAESLLNVLVRTVTLLLLAACVALWWLADQPSERPQQQSSAAMPAENRTIPISAAASAVEVPFATDSESEAEKATGSQFALAASESTEFDERDEPIKADPLQTSWQNPFSRTLWKTHNWTFDGQAMTSAPGNNVKAKFFRTYQKLMLGIELEPVGDGSMLHVQLTAPESRSTAVVSVGRGVVRVSAESPKRTSIVLKQKRLDLNIAPGQSGRLRLGATGNRLQIAWNGRRVLICDQPGEQSGQDLEITLISDGPGVRVTDLRIEGE